MGEFLESYTLHHQLLSVSYKVGGPSTGYALAINTLSALLHIPVYNDFGITGAPWTNGVKIGEVGGSVIIGGTKRKRKKYLPILERIQSIRAGLRSEIELLICARLDALRACLRSPDRDPHLSLAEI